MDEPTASDKSEHRLVVREAEEVMLPPQKAVRWWDLPADDDFPYSAPWWLRYPMGAAVIVGSYYATFEWGNRAGWIVGALLAIIGLGLLRELFLGALLAILVGLALWAVGAAVAALPVSLAIILGAMIIAQAMRR